MYLALKNHFQNDSYDYFKYNGKVNAPKDTFLKRKDRWHFEKIAKKYQHDSFQFLLANIMQNKNFWVGRAMDDKNHKIYTEWIGFVESDGYHFKQNLDEILQFCDARNINFNDLFHIETGKHPLIYKLYMKGFIHYYTFCFLASITEFHLTMDKEHSFDPMWKKESFRLKKSIPFCTGSQEYINSVIQMFT